jgi:hypothetical protein
LPALSAVRFAHAAANTTPPALVPLSGADPSAKALGYVEDSTKVDAKANPTHKPEQICATCVQFQGSSSDARAACNIYPGKSVSSRGWCKVWAQKPGQPAATNPAAKSQVKPDTKPK